MPSTYFHFKGERRVRKDEGAIGFFEHYAEKKGKRRGKRHGGKARWAQKSKRMAAKRFKGGRRRSSGG